MVDDLVSEVFKDWEHVQIQTSKKWSMVVIRDSLPHDCSVFPPINHEGLPISSQTQQSTPSSPSQCSSSLSQCSLSSYSSPSDEAGNDPDRFSPSDSEIRLPGNVSVSGWLRIGLAILRFKVLGILSSFRNYVGVGGVNWSIASTAGVVSAVLVSLVFRWVRRPRLYREESIKQLMILLKERDEKIIQLLQQIAKMNEVMLARQRV